MASSQKTLDVDSLIVNNIYTRGVNNTYIPAFRILTTDGAGGTSWTTISTLQNGGAFHSIRTTGATFTADASATTFSILDSGNAGLSVDPTAANTVFIYAKAFGKFLTTGNSLSAYNSNTGTIQSNVNFQGVGGITVRADPQSQTLIFDGANLESTSKSIYTFNQFQVYGSVSSGQTNLSSLSNIFVQATSPSSIVQFVGYDPLYIETNYSTNTLYFGISSLTTSIVSTLLGNDAYFLKFSATSLDISTFSTQLTNLVANSNFKSAISSLSTGYNLKINNYSTSIGSIEDLKIAISSVEVNAAVELASTTVYIVSDITELFKQVQSDFNTVTGSTIQTPFFWASTLVTLINTTSTTITTPDTRISSLGLTYYPTFSSVYNQWSDTRSFGKPQSIPSYTTNLDLTNNTYVTQFSNPAGIVYSSMIAVEGSFQFYPSEDVLNWSVDYSGALYLKVYTTTYSPQLPIYPKSSDFTRTSISGSIGGYNSYTTNFVYLKQNDTDYIRFNNFRDVATSNIQFTPLYRSYGYNPLDSPLYTTSIPFITPITFSNVDNPVGSPYSRLSSYVLIASTSYTTGCNTTFPFINSGIASFSFYASTPQTTATGFATDLVNYSSQIVTSSISASNAFMYGFNTVIPSTPYVFQLVFSRQINSETFTISTLFNEVKTYDRADTVYVSTFLLASTISSQNAYIGNISASSINGQQVFTPLIISSLSTSYGTILNEGQLISTTLVIQRGLSTLSTTYGILPNQAELISTSLAIQRDISTLSTTYGILPNQAELISTTLAIQRGLSTLSTTYGILPNQAELISTTLAIQRGLSTLSTTYGILPNQSDLVSTSIGLILQLSTLSTSYGTIPNMSSYSTSIGLGSVNGSNFSSFSTSYGLIANASLIQNTLSSFSTSYGIIPNMSSYSTSVGAGGVSGANLSSFSTSYGIIPNMSSYSTSVGAGGVGGTSFSSFSTSYGIIPNMSSYSTSVGAGGIGSDSISSFSTSLGPIASQAFVGVTVSTYSTTVGPVGGGGGNVIYNDAWIQQYLINAPSTINFGASVSKSSQIFIPWTYPLQINVGFMQNWVQNILAFNAILSTNVAGINYSSILVQQSTNIVNYHSANLPYITGLTLVKTAGTSGVQSLTFPQDSLVRSTYVYYNTALANLAGNNQLLAWYTNYNFGSNVASTIFAAFLTAGQPSLPQRLYSTNTTSNSIIFYFSTPQFVDLNDTTSVATISSYTMNLTAVPFSTFRYTGIAPVYQSTTVVVGAPFNFQTAQDGLGGQVVQYSATGLYPDSVYTFTTRAANSASQQGGFASTLSTVTSNLTSDSAFSGTLTFASRYYASAFRVFDSLNVVTLVNSATAWTTSAFVSPIHNVAIRGKTFTGSLSISTVITSPVITPAAQIFYNGFPATTPSAVTLNNVTLTPTSVYDRFTALGCNAPYQGYFLSASNTVTLGVGIFVANSTINTLQTTAIQSTSAGITTGQGTFSWYYDGAPGTAAITDAAFAYSPTTAPSYTAISGVQTVYGTATFSTIVGASNLGNYFYASPILSYTYLAGSASLTTTETNLTRIISGSNGGRLAQAARIGFSNGSVTSASLTSTWASSIRLAVFSSNLAGNSATSNVFLSTIIDGPSYTLITTTLPAVLPTATTSATTVGCRIWSFSSFDGTNVYVPPFIYTNAGNNSYTSYLYSHANSLIDNTVASIPASKELQVANGAHRTVGTSGVAYLNYAGTYYGNLLQNSITYTSITRNTTLRFATFGWKTASSATNYTKATFVVNYLTSGTDTIAITNNLAVFSAGNFPTVATDKVFLFYRVEDQASILPTDAGSATTTWLDANGTTGNAATALNYYNDTTGNQTQIYGGVASGATSGSGTITFPNVFVPAFATSGKDIRIIARFGVPMNWNFAMTTITLQLSF